MDLGKTVKDAVKKQGMLAWQYNTIGVSDAITMGGEGSYTPIGCVDHGVDRACVQACASPFKPARSSPTASKQ